MNKKRMQGAFFVAAGFAALLWSQQGRAQQGLALFEHNPNYLAYNGQPILLRTAADIVWIKKLENPNYPRFTDYPAEISSWGANHFVILMEHASRQEWSFARNPDPGFIEKLRNVCRRAHELGVIVGILVFGYNVYLYWPEGDEPSVSAFTDFWGGPLVLGEHIRADGYRYGFLEAADLNNNDPVVVESRQGQIDIMNWIVEATWEFPNVYYDLFWEPDTRHFWKTRPEKTEAWTAWAASHIKDRGQTVDPDIRHLIAFEKTLTVQQAADLNVDFLIEEDGHVEDTDGLPYVILSQDGIYRDTPVWNKDNEPTFNLEAMRQSMIAGSAGIGTIWTPDPEEQAYMHVLSQFAATVDNWCDEPGQEITEATVPPVTAQPGDPVVDLPPGTGCSDTRQETDPPEVESVHPVSRTEVHLKFNEPVQTGSAEDTENYVIGRDVGHPASATLMPDGNTVVLGLSGDLQDGISYPLTINNVKDRAAVPNTIPADTTVCFALFGQVRIEDLATSTGAPLEAAMLNEGDACYTDRDKVLVHVPDRLAFHTWIKTANDDKQFDGNPEYLTFTVNEYTTVFVGYDSRLDLPQWLRDWQDEGLVITGDPETYRVYSRHFPPGRVALGPNGAATSSSAMYLVLIRPTDVPACQVPDAPGDPDLPDPDPEPDPGTGDPPSAQAGSGCRTAGSTPALPVFWLLGVLWMLYTTRRLTCRIVKTRPR